MLKNAEFESACFGHFSLYAMKKVKTLKNVFDFCYLLQWKTLAGSMLCCTGSRTEWTAEEVEAQLSPRAVKNKNLPDLNIHPWDSTVNLSVHQPLYPPGKIIHIVRYYPKPMDTLDMEQR